MNRRVAEGALAATGGGLIAGAVGSLVGLGAPAAAVGAANGAISGLRGIYDWSSRRGVIAFVLDSTWALGTTAAGLASHGLGLLWGDVGYAERLSRRQNRHVYRRGFQPRRGFAITMGNVVSGAGDVDRARRARLVTDHEDVHVWQARWFGPAYPVLYLGWMAAGGLTAGLRWLAGRREPALPKLAESYAYYVNPFEWWAYSRDGHWPPSGLPAGIGWRRPIVPPLRRVEDLPSGSGGAGDGR